MQIVKLNRAEYIDSVTKIEGFNSLKFSKQALDYWDDFISWKNFPPLCMINEKSEHLSYLFYTISKDKEYLTIHYLLTPQIHRKHNYAYDLLNYLFINNCHDKIKRFKFFSVVSSLGFYNKIGLEYWGVNKYMQFYCDFKMPKNDISEIKQIVKDSSLNEISDERLYKIYDKLKDNGKDFDEKEKYIFEEALKKVDYRFHFDLLENKIKELNYSSN
jgi:hypothetical protein